MPHPIAPDLDTRRRKNLTYHGGMVVCLSRQDFKLTEPALL